MSKTFEVAILAGCCLLSLISGYAFGKGAQDVGTALFFYLLATCFFLAMFRPSSL
jgi:hypothetical protein